MLQHNLVPVVGRHGVGKPGQLIPSIANNNMHGPACRSVRVGVLADLLVDRTGPFIDVVVTVESHINLQNKDANLSCEMYHLPEMYRH